MTKYYMATDSDGRVHTRSTENRSYTHAVVRRGAAWSSWASRLDLAQKAAARRSGEGIEVLEALEITGPEHRYILKGIKEAANAAHNAHLDKLAIVPEGAKLAKISYKCEVKTAGDSDWVSNSLRFATREEAEAYGNDLFSRWTAVEQKQVVPSSDPINYRWVDGRARPIEEGV